MKFLNFEIEESNQESLVKRRVQKHSVKHKEKMIRVITVGNQNN